MLGQKLTVILDDGLIILPNRFVSDEKETSKLKNQIGLSNEFPFVSSNLNSSML